MYIFENVHPKGTLTGDCAKRAITKATGKDYIEVKRALNNTKKITGCKDYNEAKNVKYYIEKVLRLKKISFPAEPGNPRMNGTRFCAKYSKGSYILRMAHHLTACVDGVIYDTWDCSDKCVYNAWEVSR